MIDFLAELAKQFRFVWPESYYERNRIAKVKYPYLTYDFDSESLERYRDGFYIDVDIFDNSTSFKNIFEVEELLRDHFRELIVLTDKFLLQFKIDTGSKVPTESDNLKRRNLQLYVKVDWRIIDDTNK